MLYQKIGISEKKIKRQISDAKELMEKIKKILWGK